MSVRKAFFWSFSGQIISFIAVFATTVALARILSPREVGVYAVGLAVTGVLQAISAFGIGTYVVRAREVSADLRDTAFTLNAIVSAVLASAIFACSFSHYITIDEPMVATILRLLALSPLIGVLEFLPATMLQRELRFGAISTVMIVRTVANAIVSIGSALMGASSLSAAYGGLAYAIVGAVGFNLIASHHISRRLSLNGWRTMVGFGLNTFLIGGVSVIGSRLSDIILGRLLGLTALGLYSRASALSNMLFQNVYGSAARVLLAKLADDDRAGTPLRIGYLHALDLILAVMWPILAGVAVLANPAVAILFGERWLPAALPLAILMAVQALALTFAMNHELFVLRDRVGQQARMEGVRSFVGLAAFAYGCTFGLAGAAAGRLIDALVGMMLYLPRLPGLSGAAAGELGRLYIRNASVTMTAIVPALALMVMRDWSATVSRIEVASAVVSGVALWLAALAVLRHPLYGEICRWLSYRRLRAQGSS